MKDIIKTIFHNEVLKYATLIILFFVLAVHFVNKLSEYTTTKRLAEVTAQEKIREAKDSTAYALEVRQSAWADSITVAFMEEWTKVKDTEAFKNCRYTDFETRWSFGEKGYAFIVVVCDEVKNISNIGPFKPTSIFPTEVQKTVAHFKVYFNK